jgi:hypothetical protein
MCFGLGMTAAMVGVGVAGAVVTWRRGDPPAVPMILGYFALMEGLQAAGYLVVDQCGTPANQTVTALSMLHIILQPIFINIFLMQQVGASPRFRGWILGGAAVAAAVMLVQLLPWPAAGRCLAGANLCGPEWCTRWGEWHLAWDVPYNGLFAGFDRLTHTWWGFPAYIVAAFGLPLLYGAWRHVIFLVLAGPVAAGLMTDDPGEVPAIWCLFSIALVLIAINPLTRPVFVGRGR